jgi:hypothetical protein
MCRYVSRETLIRKRYKLCGICDNWYDIMRYIRYQSVKMGRQVGVKNAIYVGAWIPFARPQLSNSSSTWSR